MTLQKKEKFWIEGKPTYLAYYEDAKLFRGIAKNETC